MNIAKRCIINIRLSAIITKVHHWTATVPNSVAPVPQFCSTCTPTQLVHHLWFMVGGCPMLPGNCVVYTPDLHLSV